MTATETPTPTSAASAPSVDATASGAQVTRRTDVSSLLFLDSGAARYLVALFIASNVAFAVATAHVLVYPWMTYGAMVVVSAAAILLTRPHPDPFPMWHTIAVLGAVGSSTILVSLALPDSGDLGRATWHLGANTWLLFFLALRRRAWFAWLGMLVMTGMNIDWAISTGKGAVAGLLAMNTHMGILLVATLFALILRRTSARINALNERSIASAADAAAGDAAQQIRRARVAELADVAVPLLEEIAAGSQATDEERREYALAEAELRDGVRGRSLVVPDVAAAVRAARERGVSVTVLDDRGSAPGDGEALARMADAVVTAVDAAQGGTVTVRLWPEGRSVALSVVAHEGDSVARVSLDDDGHPQQTATSP